MLQKMFALGLVAIMAAGCAGMKWDGPLTAEAAQNIAISHRGLPVAKDILPGLHRVAVQGEFNVPSAHVIFYKHAERKTDGSDVTILYSGGEPNVWSRVLEVATGGLLNVASSGIHGISFPAARTIVNQAIGDIKGSSATADAKVGDVKADAKIDPVTNTNTNTNTNSPKACAQTTGTVGNNATVTNCP